jgi:ABC-type nitrate/sulfonate/bicarbonate transport system substrate-binding protein
MLKLFALVITILELIHHGGACRAASAPSKIIIVHGALNARIAPLWIAREQKLFAKYGADSEIIFVPQPPVMIGGLSVGEIHILYTGGTVLMGAASGGLDVKMVAALNSRVGYDVVATPSVKSVKDLCGKRFGIQNFGGGLWMGAMLGLEHLGLDPQRDNINFLIIGDQTVLAQALESGRIDATLLDGLFSRKLKQKGFSILAELSQSNIPYVGLGVVTRTAFVREQAEALEGVVKSLIESVAFILSPKNKSVVLKTMAKYLKLSDPVAVEEGYQDLLASIDRRPIPSLDGLRNMQRLLKTRNPKLEGLKVEDLVDDRIVKKLKETGFISRQYSIYGVK